MSIATAITAAQGKVADAYTAISNKGGTLPATQNLSNMPTAIASIPTSTPSTFLGFSADTWAGLSISNSGVLSKTSFVVQGYGERPHLTGSLDFSAVTSIATAEVLLEKFIGQYDLTGTVNFSNCTSITGNRALREAFVNSSITVFNFSGLVSIQADEVFNGCCSGATALASIDFSNLEEVIGNYVFQNAFQDCYLTTASFDKLETISGNQVFAYTFQGNNRLVSLSFPALNSVTGTNVFADMLYNCDGVTVHFPTAMQSVLGNDPAVVAGFGGTNITVLFDL